MSRWATIGLLLAATFGLICWDIYVAVNGVVGDTISEVVLSTAGRYAVLPLALGVVMGHILWPRDRIAPRWITFFGLGVVGSVVLVFDLIGHGYIVPVVPFVAGVVTGHFFWSQRRE